MEASADVALLLLELVVDKMFRWACFAAFVSKTSATVAGFGNELLLFVDWPTLAKGFNEKDDFIAAIGTDSTILVALSFELLSRVLLDEVVGNLT